MYLNKSVTILAFFILLITSCTSGTDTAAPEPSTSITSISIPEWDPKNDFEKEIQILQELHFVDNSSVFFLGGVTLLSWLDDNVPPDHSFKLSDCEIFSGQVVDSKTTATEIPTEESKNSKIDEAQYITISILSEECSEVEFDEDPILPSKNYFTYNPANNISFKESTNPSNLGKTFLGKVKRTENSTITFAESATLIQLDKKIDDRYSVILITAGPEFNEDVESITESLFLKQ